MLIYVVKQGDTLSNIANEFGTTTEKLILDNGIPNPGQLVVGQSVIITNAAEEEKLRSVLAGGYAYPYINQQVLEGVLPVLSSITIFGYGFHENGELIGLNDDRVIETALKASVNPIMMLNTVTETGTFSNDRSSLLLENKELQEVVIDNVLALMNEKGYVGLDIDFEYVKPEERVAYADFIRYTTQRLNQVGYSVNVDLAPKTSPQQRGLLYEAHDYGLIGAAANTVLLMTYEWGYTYGNISYMLNNNPIPWAF